MKKFQTFQGLRAIAMLLVFFSHCNHFLPLPSGGHGAIGVEIFLIMSGFLVELRAPKKEKTLMHQALSYTKQKVRKFYWLHATMMLAAMGPTILGWVLEPPTLYSMKDYACKIVANLLLVQSWIPDSDFYFSLNGVSWYLSTSLFLYFCSPFLHGVVNKLETVRKKVLCIAAIFLGQVILATAMRNSSYLHAVIYIHPVARLFDFAVGMLLGSIYKNNAKTPMWNWSNMEAIAISALLVVIVSFPYLPEAYSYVVLSMPMASLLIFVFAYESGNISRMITRKEILFLGNYSFEIFMVHRVVLGYWEYVQWIARKLLNRNLPGIVSTVCTLLISILAAWIFRKIERIFSSKHLRTLQ